MERRANFLAIVLALFFIAQAIGGNQLKSLTWDEPSFVGAGYAMTQWGDYEVFSQNPPLPQALAALPFLFNHEGPRPAIDGDWRKAENPKVQLGANLVYLSGLSPESTAFWARAPNICLGGVLVLAVFALGRRLLGPIPALIAAALAAFSPNLLAHGKVATADLSCTLGFVAAIYFYHRTAVRSASLQWLPCGIATGLALLTKYTSLLLGPVFLIIGLLDAGFRQRSLSGLLFGGLTVVLCSTLIITFAYIGDRAPGWGLIHYFERLQTLYSDHNTGLRHYLLGNTSTEPRWYYYLLTLAIKLPIGTLLLTLLGLLALGWHPSSGQIIRYVGVPAAMILLATCFDSVNIGMRRTLPALPFLFLLGASFYRQVGWQRIATCALLATTVSSTLAQAPHHISFISYAFGGPNAGPYLLDDSNIDWGQDLPLLAAWQAEQTPGRPLKLLYYGTALPRFWRVAAEPFNDSEIERPGPGTYAVSVHALASFRKFGRRDWLTDFKPDAIVGRSIYIYSFKEPAHLP